MPIALLACAAATLLTAVGAAGYWLLRRGLAPASAHTLTMTLSIWLEAAAGAALLLVLAKTFSSGRPAP